MLQNKDQSYKVTGENNSASDKWH